MKTWHLHLNGRVQGVGFRPNVCNFALRERIEGYVLNGSDGVHIYFNTIDRNHATRIQENLINQLPGLAKVDFQSLKECEYVSFSGFEIRESIIHTQSNLTITPDLATCKSCQAEIMDFENRRYQYAFTTCTDCGPRYSIMDSLPYDRHRTSMKDFNLCKTCQTEFEKPADRRFYSQTQSCGDCGIQMDLIDVSESKHMVLSQREIILKCAQIIREGNIIAIKGIGGYLIMCDAKNEETLKELRSRKNRPTKPLAVMYPSFMDLRKEFYICEKEEIILQNEISPIVLLEPKENCSIKREIIAHGLNKVGVMLPYTPLFSMLLKEVGHPVVATSGNPSGSPIVYRDQESFNQLSNIVDYILTHNRIIYTPQDDSVLELSRKYQTPILLRRSRGYAPTSPSIDHQIFPNGWLAMGADLKSTFSISHQGKIYTSQYLGDMGSYDTEIHYEATLVHLTNLLGFDTKVILTDKHPGYFSTILGNRKAKTVGCSIIKIQHHEAHFAAVLAENNLIHSNEPVMGVMWDGTGLGNDDNIWGGEFFEYNQYSITHKNQFHLFPHILNDKFSREPLIPALSLLQSYKISFPTLFKQMDQEKLRFYKKILMAGQNIKTSSIGRVFDALAFLLGFNKVNTYEAEAASYLQNLAENYVEQYGLITRSTLLNLDTKFDEFLQDFVILCDSESMRPQLAFEFHLWLIELIERYRAKENYRIMAFSGGVFQNSLLVDLIQKKYDSSNIRLCFHCQLPANDESISYGQLAHQYIAGFKHDLIQENLNKLYHNI